MRTEHLVKPRQRGVNRLAILFLSLVCSACLGIPDNAKAVEGFELERYLGTWYEIGRLDHRFERGLTHVTAQYSLRDDGGISVTNSGFDTRKNEWSTAEGKAYFVGDSQVGKLKVSFFGPFYGAYNVVELDKEGYQYAMVVGPNTKYLWILARSPRLDQNVLNRLVDKAADLGFPTETLIFPEHGDQPLKNSPTASRSPSRQLDLDASTWRSVNDGVMGGVSQSSVSATPEGLTFSGTLSLENNGGFASTRRSIGQSVDGLSAILMRVRGDGRRYQLRLRQDNNWDGVAWRQAFDTTSDWQDLTFPIDNFEPVFRGRTLPGYEPLETSRIRQVGLMLADGQSGTFALDISSIHFQF